MPLVHWSRRQCGTRTVRPMDLGGEEGAICSNAEMGGRRRLGTIGITGCDPPGLSSLRGVENHPGIRRVLSAWTLWKSKPNPCARSRGFVPVDHQSLPSLRRQFIGCDRKIKAPISVEIVG